MNLGVFFCVSYVLIILYYVIIGILFVVVVSLIFRPYVLWYFKINKKLKLQEETNRLLEEMASSNNTASAKPRVHEWSSYLPK